MHLPTGDIFRRQCLIARDLHRRRLLVLGRLRGMARATKDRLSLAADDVTVRPGMLRIAARGLPEVASKSATA